MQLLIMNQCLIDDSYMKYGGLNIFSSKCLQKEIITGNN